jgi:hypothetical protein
MPEINPQLLALLSDTIRIIFTLPDPPPEPFKQLNDVAILTVITALTERLSPEIAADLRKTLPAAKERLRAA